MFSIGSRQLPQLGSILLEQRAAGEIGGIPTGGENDGSIGLLLLPLVFVFDTNDCFAILEYTSDIRLLEDLDPVWDLGCQILNLLELGIGNDHSGELGTTTVSTRLRVTT